MTPLSKVTYIDATTGQPLFQGLFFGLPNHWGCGEFVTYHPNYPQEGEDEKES